MIAGRYEQGEVIGRGATSTVRRGWDHRTGRPVALKIVDVTTALDRSRVLREVLAHRLAAGTAAVAMHDISAMPDRVVFVLELADGQILTSLVGSPVADAARITASAARAAATLHDRGVVHRDLMPANLVIAPSGAVRLLDLGSASTPEWQRVAPPDLEARGSPEYAAPEQLAGAPAVPAADIWSLGVVLAELAAGRRPRTGQHPVEVLRPIYASSPLAEVVAHLAAPRPVERPTDAMAAAALLDQLADDASPGGRSAAAIAGWTSHRRRSS